MSPPDKGTAPITGTGTAHQDVAHTTTTIISAAADAPHGYAAAAWDYRHQGWQRPIPIRPPDDDHDGKNPPPSGYTGHAGLTPSGADIQAWIEDRPADNIAIVMADVQ